MERCVLYTHIISILAFGFRCNISAHTHSSSKTVGNDKSTPNHTCPSKSKEIIEKATCVSHSKFIIEGEILSLGTLLSAKFHNVHGFVFKFLLLPLFSFCSLRKKEEKMKNPETHCFYKCSSISSTGNFFYLWLFGSHN